MSSTNSLIPKKRTALEMAAQHGLSIDEYIRRYGYPYYIRYEGARNDN